MLALGIRYLTGYAVATDVASREHAEWPPHPARVFMAMAAAMFETGEYEEERAALEWLERQGPPELYAQGADARDIVTQYVPVNDKAGPAKMALQSLPTLTRHKAERTFPCVRPIEDTVYLRWSDEPDVQQHLPALSRICRKVTRVGHSSSLVQMWVEEEPPASNLAPVEFGGIRLRVAGRGTLKYLEDAANLSVIGRHAALQERIARADNECKALQGERHCGKEAGDPIRDNRDPERALGT